MKNWVIKKLFISMIIISAANVLPAYAADVERVSVDSLGNQSAGGSSQSASISADGRFVAFSSDTINLVTGDSNGFSDIFVHDRDTDTTTLASLYSNSVQGNHGSYKPSISADGRFVAFESNASNLVTGDTNGRSDVFVHDRNTNTTTRVNLDSNGVQGNAYGASPAISANGRFVAFESLANNLVTGDTNGVTDIFVHDRNTNITTRVSINSNGTEGDRSSYFPVISANGRFVAFSSNTTNLVAGDNNNRKDIFVHDRNTSITTRASVNSFGTQADHDSFNPTLSADGRFVAFSSYASNLVTGDTNGTRDIFVHDRNTSITTRISIDASGVQGDGSSANPAISADGRFVAFQSYATNLVTGDTNGENDVFVHDRNTSITTRASLDANGVQGNAYSAYPAISADGRFVAFESPATNLVAGDSNGVNDIFVASISIPSKQDFNADGKADILWRHAMSGQNYLYMMDGISVTSSGAINTVDDENWQIAGAGDFNADGKADILWRHAVSGQNFVYFMNGSSIVGSGLINTVNDLNWKVAGVGDFDGDSKADILWRHSGTGQNFIYLMDGAAIIGSGLVNIVDDLNWKVAGVGDFDGDSKTDILWRNSATGFNYLYLMDGVSVKSFVGINTVEDQNWQIKAVSDFNSDGNDDILWRHAGSGDNYLYMMNANAISSSGAINTVTDLNWRIEKANDFNGDGMADILWRHSTTGENHLYLMNGNSIINSGTINTVPDLSWEVQ